MVSAPIIVDAAKSSTQFSRVTFGQANLLTFDLVPVGPLLPLGMLMKAK